MSPEEKEPFNIQAREDKIRYHTELEQYSPQQIKLVKSALSVPQSNPHLETTHISSKEVSNPRSSEIIPNQTPNSDNTLKSDCGSPFQKHSNNLTNQNSGTTIEEKDQGNQSIEREVEEKIKDDLRIIN